MANRIVDVIEGKKLKKIFLDIDLIIQKVDSSRIEPKLSEEIKMRKQRNPDTVTDDVGVLSLFARLIAFSQNAPSDKVEAILNKGIFDDIFCNFEIRKVSQINPQDIINKHWDKIRVIRFKNKVKSIVGCAKSLESIEAEYCSFGTLLKRSDIPKCLKSKNDVERFWDGFNNLKNKMKDVKMPFFRSSTSLLHLLLHIGFPCIKPDLIVMRVAKEIGIVDSEKGELNFLRSVKVIQLYSIDKDIKPSIVDLYLLIHGGQRWAMQFVKPSFYK